MPKEKRQFPTLLKTTTKEGKVEYQRILMRKRRSPEPLPLSKLLSQHWRCEFCGANRGHKKNCPLTK